MLNNESVRFDFTAYCTDDGWTIFQSRGQFGNPANYFYKGWADYLNGFGTPGEEAWLGLNMIYQLTNLQTYRLRVKLKAPNEEIGYAFYETFKLENSVSAILVFFHWGLKLRNTVVSPNSSQAKTQNDSKTINHSFLFSQDAFNLSISGFSGAAGDPFTNSHQGMGFSTYDQINGPDAICPSKFKGAWW